MSGSIVCGVDDSRHARAAARVAGDLAHRLGAPLILVTVADGGAFLPPPGRVPRLPYAHAPAYREALEERGRAALAAVAEDAGVAGDTERRVIVGDMPESLLEEARAEDALIIVVGSRGMGGVRSALLGSTSSAVLRDADRPVLVVPEEVAG
jgi:nucleotide-binding universal stress UspA family protein